MLCGLFLKSSSAVCTPKCSEKYRPKIPAATECNRVEWWDLAFEGKDVSGLGWVFVLVYKTPSSLQRSQNVKAKSQNKTKKLWEEEDCWIWIKYKMVLGEMWLEQDKTFSPSHFCISKSLLALQLFYAAGKPKTYQWRLVSCFLFPFQGIKSIIWILFTLKDVFLQKRNPKTKSATCLAWFAVF